MRGLRQRLEDLESEVGHSFEVANILIDQKNNGLANAINSYKRFRVNKEAMELYGVQPKIELEHKAFKAQQKILAKAEADKEFAQKLEEGNKELSLKLVC